MRSTFRSHNNICTNAFGVPTLLAAEQKSMVSYCLAVSMDTPDSSRANQWPHQINGHVDWGWLKIRIAQAQ